MNAITQAGSQLAIPEEEAIRVLGNSLYPGAKPESIRMVLSWCRATGRDPMKRPIHIVPMWVEDKVSGAGEMRDVLMPGIGTYRSDAAGTGQYAGKSEPEFGPDVAATLGQTRVTYPKWCKVTVQRLVGGQVRSFVAKEFWIENYATVSRHKVDPNYMWKKRPYAQLAKCAEAQALRMAFPDETGNTNTSEEMEGKSFEGTTLEAEPETVVPPKPERIEPPQTAPSTTDRAAAATAPRKTYRDLIEDVRNRLSFVTTRDEVVAMADEEAIKYALSRANAGIKQEFNDLFGDAFGRFKEEENGAGPDDEFPGDIP